MVCFIDFCCYLGKGDANKSRDSDDKDDEHDEEDDKAAAAVPCGYAAVLRSAAERATVCSTFQDFSAASIVIYSNAPDTEMAAYLTILVRPNTSSS
jgi:hypothetical protein